jgi:hypothetical protein
MEKKNLDLFSTRPGHVFRNTVFNTALAKKIL